MIAQENQNKDKAKNENTTRFAGILSQLRKERGISQKKAAADLGISQALLSHYEKGIRECGLSFVIRCSEYYGVTTDYLLGVSDSRNGLELIDLVDSDKNDELSPATLIHATQYLLNLLSAGTDKKTMSYVYNYTLLCVYREATTMAKAGILPKEMFKIDYTLGRELASAATAMEDAKFVFIEDKSRTGSDTIERTSLHTAIEKAEEYILNTFILE